MVIAAHLPDNLFHEHVHAVLVLNSIDFINLYVDYVTSLGHQYLPQAAGSVMEDFRRTSPKADDDFKEFMHVCNLGLMVLNLGSDCLGSSWGPSGGQWPWESHSR